MVENLIEATQAKFSLLATTAGNIKDILLNTHALTSIVDHFSQYFKRVEDGDPDHPTMMFDWTSLKASYKSFVDSIVIELCLPQSKFPRHVLTLILREAIEEVPGESKRFPQALWDALGDLSVSFH